MNHGKSKELYAKYVSNAIGMLDDDLLLEAVEPVALPEPKAPRPAFSVQLFFRKYGHYIAASFAVVLIVVAFFALRAQKSIWIPLSHSSEDNASDMPNSAVGNIGVSTVSYKDGTCSVAFSGVGRLGTLYFVADNGATGESYVRYRASYNGNEPPTVCIADTEYYMIRITNPDVDQITVKLWDVHDPNAIQITITDRQGHFEEVLVMS